MNMRRKTWIYRTLLVSIVLTAGWRSEKIVCQTDSMSVNGWAAELKDRLKLDGRYDDQPAGQIPANSELVFYVEILVSG